MNLGQSYIPHQPHGARRLQIALASIETICGKIVVAL